MSRYDVMVDTIGADVRNIPAGTAKVGGYLTGSGGIQWPPSGWARFHGAKVPIDQQPGINPWLSYGHVVYDVENGAKTIFHAVQGAKQRAAHGLPSTIYIQASNLFLARATVKATGLRAFVTYFVANWNLNQAEAVALLQGDVVAIQWASPTSNPHTPLPGSRLTLAESNCDLSVTVPTWFPVPGPPRKRPPLPKPHPKVTGSAAGAALTVAIAAVLKAAGVHITPVEAAAISTLGSALGGYITPAKTTP